MRQPEEVVGRVICGMNGAGDLTDAEARSIAREAMRRAEDYEGEEWAYRVAFAAQALLRERNAHH